MLCCLNPDCPNPLNPDSNRFCQNCATPLIALLRGHYRVIRPLSAQGGFGRTYLAEDIDKLHERCVVKQLAPNVQGTWALKKAIELFQQEARQLQELGQHHQIPTLFAYFEQDNYLYLVQQFIDGYNLLEELQQKSRYSESKIRELLLDLLPVFKFIHQRGVIHRDIKPQNIMRRSSQGDLVLIDFGASKQLSATVQTRMGTTIGSHGYTPIEQMQGGEAYPASDLYSLGATCFYLLTDVSPYQLWIQQGYGWVVSWQQHLRSPISPQLTQVLDRLLKIDIKERYQSVDEVLESLTPQPSSVPPTLLTATSKTDDKNRKYLFLVGAGVVLLAIGGAWYLQSHPFVMSESPKLNTTLPITSKQPILPKTLSGHSSDVNSVAFAPDRKTLASGSDDNTIKLWSIETGEPIQTLTGHTSYIYSVAFAPDGKTLASGGADKTIKLWNLTTGQAIHTFRGHTDVVTSIALSHDGKILASGSADKTIKLWNLTTQQQINVLKGHSAAVKSVAFSPDGKMLASGSLDKTIKLWNPVTGQQIRTLNGHSDRVLSVAFNTDGLSLASGSQDKTIKLWNLLTGEVTRTLSQHSEKVNSVAYVPTPNGQLLASGSNDNTIKLWNVTTGEEIQTLKGDSGYIYSIAISPDGHSLASGGAGSNILKVWRISP